MGLWSKVFSWLRAKKRPITLIFVGLDNAGKTTIINSLNNPKKSQTGSDVAPTLGYDLKQVIHSNTSFVIHDMSGQSKYRDMWGSFYNKCDAIVFVLDSSDKIRITVAKEELDTVLEHPDIAKRDRLPVLFYANKTDVRNSMSAIKCAQMMGLDAGNWIRKVNSLGRPWHICSTNALTGDGLQEGMEWIIKQIVDKNDRT